MPAFEQMTTGRQKAVAAAVRKALEHTDPPSQVESLRRASEEAVASMKTRVQAASSAADPKNRRKALAEEGAARYAAMGIKATVRGKKDPCD